MHERRGDEDRVPQRTPADGDMCQRMEQKITENLYLNVGMIHDYGQDKSIVLERARRGVEAMGLQWSDLIQRDRRGHVADTRHMVSKYLRDHGFVYREISAALGRINHTTSCYSVRQANNLISIDREYARNYEKFLNA